MATGKNEKKRRPRRRKRCSLDEALRLEGLDEIGYAHTLGGFFTQLEGNTGITKLKLKLDGLKELSRHLEPKRPAPREGDDAPVMVQMVHNVARPPRTDAPEARGGMTARTKGNRNKEVLPVSAPPKQRRQAAVLHMVRSVNGNRATIADCAFGCILGRFPH
jgi:hypothetical protein